MAEIWMDEPLLELSERNLTKLFVEAFSELHLTSISSSESIAFGLLTLLVFSGTTLNLHRFVSVLRVFKRRASRLRLLELHICIGDLMVLWFYGIEKAVGHMTIYWIGDDFLCVVVMTLQSVAFHFLAASIAVLGIDRMLGILRPFHFSPAGKRMRSIAIFVYSTVFSVPQLIMWESVEIGSDEVGQIRQCLWFIDKHLLLPWAAEEITSHRLLESTATILYCLSVFWVPLLVMGISYSFLIKSLLANERKLNRFQSAANGDEEDVAPIEEQERRIIADSERTDRAMRTTHFSIQTGSGLGENSGAHRMNLRKSREVSKSTLTSRTPQRSKPEKTIKTVIVLITVYTMCWLPHHLGFLMPFIFQGGYKSIASECLILLSTIINPLVYGRFKKCKGMIASPARATRTV